MLSIPNLVTLGVVVVWALMGIELFFAARRSLLAAGKSATEATIWAVLKGITSPVYLAYKAIIGLIKAVVAEYSPPTDPVPIAATLFGRRRRRRRRRPQPTPAPSATSVRHKQRKR